MNAPRTRPAILLPAGGLPTLERAFPIDDLARLQQVVGGYIEIVRIHHAAVQLLEARFNVVLGPDAVLVVNEEGKLLGLPYNAAASVLVFMLDQIVGDCLVVDMPPSDEQEDDT